MFGRGFFALALFSVTVLADDPPKKAPSPLDALKGVCEPKKYANLQLDDQLEAAEGITTSNRYFVATILSRLAPTLLAQNSSMVFPAFEVMKVLAASRYQATDPLAAQVDLLLRHDGGVFKFPELVSQYAKTAKAVVEGVTPGVERYTSTRLWTNDDRQALNPTLATDQHRNFLVKNRGVSFSRPVKTKEAINQTVSRDTRLLFLAVLGAAKVYKGDSVYGTVASYLGGSYQKAFSETVEGEFEHLGIDGTVHKVFYNVRTGEERIADTKEFRSLSLPLVGGNIVLDFVVPKEHLGMYLASFNLEKLNSLMTVLESAPLVETRIKVPPLNLQLHGNLLQSLRSGGLLEVENQQLSRIHLGARIVLPGKGFEAAPQGPTTGVPEFIIDKPFLLLVRDVKNDLILDTAAVLDPGFSIPK